MSDLVHPTIMPALSILPPRSSSWAETLTYFSAVDDTVREGGTSKSYMTVVKFPHANTACFQGFLDTTTLRGAGFASQAYYGPLPAELSPSTHSGIKLTLLVPIEPSGVDATKTSSFTPGGGLHSVTRYVLSFKTDAPQREPDGGRGSVITYDLAFEPSSPSPDPSSPWSRSALEAARDRIDMASWNTGLGGRTVLGQTKLVTLGASWSDFVPTHRGKEVPRDKAPLLDPSEVKVISFMARSDFGEQSGPFELHIISLDAVLQ
ncbi:uncharacterized protein EI90DRAFT_3120616 [Cantharellus anzutake]|uniref:uncharacterized protein n=1 Tax=Cantharellus anzutake TaxID=1750568 RepID=UPI001906DDB2|nr:uncharacterized protein EI90DRAFT_3120616 [Cantharellus anzutake]KAF8334860.1 hypothetical protein EI90DRAFT_3120616 [Cantharellus anzutake]